MLTPVPKNHPVFGRLQLLLAKMPHIIPHTERVQLFRKFVANEKTVLGLTESACAAGTSTLVTIHRQVSTLENPYLFSTSRFYDNIKFIDSGAESSKMGIDSWRYSHLRL